MNPLIMALMQHLKQMQGGGGDQGAQGGQPDVMQMMQDMQQGMPQGGPQAPQMTPQMPPQMPQMQGGPPMAGFHGGAIHGMPGSAPPNMLQGMMPHQHQVLQASQLAQMLAHHIAQRRGR